MNFCNQRRTFLSLPCAILVAAAVLAATAAPAPAAEAADMDLAKTAQNPIADLISLPLQNNFEFGVGPGNDMRYTLNIQPVMPQAIGKDWNWIHRVIAPVIYQPEVVSGGDDRFGFGDLQYQGFLGPATPGEAGIIWGAGPVLSIPTAGADILGTGKWSAGAGIIGLRMVGPWVYGALVNNIWSFENGNDRPGVNLMTLQYFVNYNFPKCYLTTSPINTVNWKADDDQRWTIPLGGGIGKVLKIGKVPVNTLLQAYTNVEHPDNGPEWSVRLQFQFLFPN